MRRPRSLIAVSAAFLMLLATVGPASAGFYGGRSQQRPALSLVRQGRASVKAVPSAGALRAQIARLPLSFERNVGQSATQVQFLARVPGGTVFLTHTEAVLVLDAPGPRTPGARAAVGRELPQQPGPVSVLRLRLVGANAHAPMVGWERLPGQVNYYLGNQPQRWHTHVPTFAQVAYHNVYPGVDLLYSGTREQLTYDFVLAPGARPAAIRLAVAGAQRLTLDRTGALLLTSGVGTLRQEQPRAYQVLGGQRRAIAVRYVLRGQSQVGLAVARYDVRQPLLIDPSVRLIYSTLLGGSDFNDAGNGIAVDSSGNAYVAGSANSSDFLATSLFGPISNLAVKLIKARVGPHANVFVTKLDASGSKVLYSTLIGGSNTDFGNGIAVDRDGNAYVTGATSSTDFPITLGRAPQFTYGGGSFDAYVAKLDAGGALVRSTYLGGPAEDWGNAIAVDGDGIAYITGYTDSAPTGGLAFLASTSTSQTLTSLGRRNAFVVALESRGFVAYDTLLGCLLNSCVPDTSTTEGHGIAVDRDDNVYVTGFTTSPNFLNACCLLGRQVPFPFQPGLSGGRDAFVVVLDAAAGGLLSRFTTPYRYATYLGGSSGVAGLPSVTQGNAIAVDGDGKAYVTGDTNSTNFPVNGTFHAYQPNYGGVCALPSLPPDRSILLPVCTAGPGFDGGRSDAFVTVLDPTQSGPASLVYSTYLGGSNAFVTNGEDVGTGIAVDETGKIYVTGYTESPDFPNNARTAPRGVVGRVLQPAPAAVSPTGGFDTFVVKLNPFAGEIFSLLYFGFLGGFGSTENRGTGIAVDGKYVYVTGFSTGVFPTTHGAFQEQTSKLAVAGRDAFVVKFTRG